MATGSVHVDPGAGWFPHFLGFAARAGRKGRRRGGRDLPLAPDSGDGPWPEAASRPRANSPARPTAGLVVPLGASMPPAVTPRVRWTGVGRRVTRAAGELLGGLGLPTAIVQEGGYDLDRIGELVVASLEGFSSARR